MRKKNLRILALLVWMGLSLRVGAQDQVFCDDALAPAPIVLSADLERLKDEVGREVAKGEFRELLDALKSLAKKDAFTRQSDVYFYEAYVYWRQLEAWKESKDWQNVYDEGPAVRNMVRDKLREAEKWSQGRPDMLLNVAFLRWQLTADEDPERAAALFDTLIQAATENAATPESALLIKAFADTIAGLEDKNLSRRLYEVYGQKIMSSDMSADELKNAALDFARQQNIYLAKTLFEKYLDTFPSGSLEQARAMIFVAGTFAHPGHADSMDPVYAQVLYRKAFEQAGEEAFDAVSQYRRAFNLERMRDYEGARKQYELLFSVYLDDRFRREAQFRCGILSAYAFGDTAEAARLFKDIKSTPVPDHLTLSSLYQLGVLSQASGDAQQANVFYEQLLVAGASLGLDAQKHELLLETAERLSELSEKKPMKYALRLALTSVFGPATQDAGIEDVQKPLSLHVDLTGRPHVAGTGGTVAFDVTTSHPMTGCMMPVFAYEWSGETGQLINIPNTATLSTAYGESGIKVVFVAVVGNNGLEGTAFEMIKINDK